MGLFDDEEEEVAPAPLMPMQGAPQPISPVVKDYLADKYGLGERQKIVDENKAADSGVDWRSGLAALGAGLQGKNALEAGLNMGRLQKADREAKLADFDKEGKFARESDPNSEESKASQELAIKMGMSPDKAVNLTAAKFKELSPVLAKVYGIDEGLKIRDDDRDFKREQLAQNERLRKAELAARAEKEGAKFTPGQQALDKSFAKEYDEWTSGGEAGVDKNLKRLQDARQKLAASKNDTIGYSGIQGRLPDFLRSEDSKTIQQDVQAAAQGALKATLGAQFTEKEGERIMKSSYDPTLSPEANIKKIDAAIAELSAAKANKDSKAAHFETQGTLVGYQPKRAPAGKTVVKKLVSPSTGKTKLVYSDGTEEVQDAVVGSK